MKFLKFQIDQSTNKENISSESQNPFNTLSWQYYEHQFLPPRLKKSEDSIIGLNRNLLNYLNPN